MWISKLPNIFKWRFWNKSIWKLKHTGNVKPWCPSNISISNNNKSETTSVQWSILAHDDMMNLSFTIQTISLQATFRILYCTSTRIHISNTVYSYEYIRVSFVTAVRVRVYFKKYGPFRILTQIITFESCWIQLLVNVFRTLPIGLWSSSLHIFR